ncbi:hypothetical protein V5799_020139, partial [Amblyomma americanum]
MVAFPTQPLSPGSTSGAYIKRIFEENKTNLIFTAVCVRLREDASKYGFTMFLSAAPSQYESTWSDDGRNGGLDDEVIGSKGIGGGGSEPGGCKRCTSHPT